ncbi:glycosyltransferase family 2 protein [Lacticaseibacillus rhamnosus]|uniref:glycosyltransferase family 2 protein n=1 Tax=Lacticaseibacillus rhamnosus TaxID=47715 RepID=UPI0004E3AA29|nr:glycosyltransferase family 2 protein [Lacticaseibacillus rhamnosus]KFC33123.1 glycosyl transferase family 2 [Lacticaseibacillus rhamnosus K32]MDE3302468.1 glycosyltransferase family 2 protein [Lacticaseibacillus rhamnosus]OAT94245.1 glycosyl transferase family 2 [Lacticaseibacillus rhamnosus]WHM89038.1 glycosyltransferase family 2 protein [Lacticaseibacillus rhamnosus]
MTKGSFSVAICLATYNGQDYLREQLESIISQSFTNWKLFIRDDGSTDSTPEIINQFVLKNPEKIVNLSGLKGGGNSTSNFMTILKWVSEHEDPDYYMFSDQDDVWLPDKVSFSVQALGDSQLPKLVHTDLRVVDESLKIITDSFIRYSNLNPDKRDLSHILIQNNVTGCTMLWNRSLNRLIDFRISDRILMHDWWIALVAAAFGTIVFVKTPTILYRQHKKNVVGAQQVGSLSYILSKLRSVTLVKQGLKRTFDQAQLLKDIYGSRLSNNANTILDEFLSLPQKSKFSRIYKSFRFGFIKQSMVQIIGQMIFI